MSALKQAFSTWYRESLALEGLEGGAAYQKLLDECPAKTEDPDSVYPASGRVRMSKFLQLRLQHPIAKNGYTVAVLSAEMADAETKPHYAIVYWRNGSEDPDPEYICTGSTFDSADGEYRPRFIRYSAFTAAYAELSQKMEPFEKAITDMISEGVLELSAEVHPVTSAEPMLKIIDEHRLLIRAFAVSLIMDLWEHASGLTMNHVSKPYSKIISLIADAFPDLVAASKESYTNNIINVFRSGHKEFLSVRCGQKLVPMFMREAMEPFDPGYAVWRELLVAQVVTDLVINFVTPGFSIFNQFSSVEHSGAALYENATMGQKYARGLAAEASMAALREARRALDVVGVEEHVQSNPQTNEYRSRMYEALEYAQSFLNMAPVSMLMTMEDVGGSLYNYGKLVRTLPAVPSYMPAMFSDMGLAAKLMFDYVYSAHCMHSKLGVVHCDLHANNLTVYRWGRTGVLRKINDKPVDQSYYDNPHVMYVLGGRGEADSYMFPATGSSGVIIDFSRALLGPAARPLILEDRTEQFADNFYNDQVDAIVRTIKRYATALSGEGGRTGRADLERIRAVALSNLEALFPVLCAVDFIALGRALATTFELEARIQRERLDPDARRDFHVAPAAIAMARRIEAAGLAAFIGGLREIARAGAGRERLEIAPWPGAAIIKDVFADWQFTRLLARDMAGEKTAGAANPDSSKSAIPVYPQRRIRTAQLVDAYNYENPIRGVSRDYERWPRWARVDEISRHLGDLTLEDLFAGGVDGFFSALKPGVRTEALAEALRADAARQNGPDATSTSVWTDATF